MVGNNFHDDRREVEWEELFLITYPAFRTAPVQLNDAAAVPVAFALYGDAMILSPSSSSEIAVVKLIRSSSLICKKLRIERIVSRWKYIVRKRVEKMQRFIIVLYIVFHSISFRILNYNFLMH